MGNARAASNAQIFVPPMHIERNSESSGPFDGSGAPARQRSTPASRVVGLPAMAIRSLQQAARHIDLRRLDDAAESLREAHAIAPEHPEILRLEGVLAYRQNRHGDAIALLQRSLAAWPDDALALGNLGNALAGSGRIDEALATMRRACEVAPDLAGAWLSLGKLLDSQGSSSQAESALQRAVALAPGHSPSRLAHAGVLATLARNDESAAEYRALLGRNARSMPAWLGLARIGIAGEDDIAALEPLCADASLSDEDRALAGFALGKMLENAGRHAAAFAAFSNANALRRRNGAWDAAAFSRKVDAIAAAFSASSDEADTNRGDGVIFVVGLPRTQATRVERILAAHPDVGGTSESADLEAVVFEESSRRNERFPDWVRKVSRDDWQRMGERYLERIAPRRRDGSHFVDRMPDNWLLAGAALTMLPGACVVDVRRDPLEACWASFAEPLSADRHPYSHDLADLAEIWRDYVRLSDVWLSRFPGRFRQQSQEAWLDAPDRELAALFDFCGLDVGRARGVEQDSPQTKRAAAYGESLAPLRRMLADADIREATDRIAPIEPERRQRVQDLDDDRAREVLRAAALLGSGRADAAAEIIESAHAAHPEHPEILRLLGALHSARGQHGQALDALTRAAALKPDDALIVNTLGTAQAASGDADAALASFTRADEPDPAAANAAYNLGNALVARGRSAAAQDAFERALAAEPGFVPARLALAEVLRDNGEDDGAAAQWRRALADDPHASAAWQGFAELRGAEFTAAERDALESEYRRPRIAEADRAALGFALGHVLESRAEYPQAFGAFFAANAIRRRAIEWSSDRRSRYCDEVLEAFAQTPTTMSESTLGEGFVFLLGLPDAASAAIARLFASHPAFDNERAAPPSAILRMESTRRARKFPEWAAQATPADWQRLGRAYLARHAPSSHSHRFLDAASLDPALAGALASMLPAARFVAICRDPLEACWSCFKSDRASRRWSHDIAEIAAYRRDHERLMMRWIERHPNRVHVVDCDALLAGATSEIDRLFAHCGLSPAATTFATIPASAAAYGDLLKPLAQMLAAEMDLENE